MSDIARRVLARFMGTAMEHDTESKKDEGSKTASTEERVAAQYMSSVKPTEETPKG